MSRQYHHPIEVQCSGPAQMEPTVFRWHGRVHVVRLVIAQWTQRLPWWQMTEQDTTSISALEQHVWRVEASIGSIPRTGIYDLGHDECWRLLAVAD